MTSRSSTVTSSRTPVIRRPSLCTFRRPSKGRIHRLLANEVRRRRVRSGRWFRSTSSSDSRAGRRRSRAGGHMKTRILFSSIAGLLLLTSCVPAPAAPTPDIGLIQTSAAQTVVANFTLTAAITSTAVPTETQTQVPLASIGYGDHGHAHAAAGRRDGHADPVRCAHLRQRHDRCERAGQHRDAVGPEVREDVASKKQRLMHLGGGLSGLYTATEIASGGVAAAVPFTGVVAPGQEVEVSVNFTAPTKAGSYASFWQMANAAALPFPRPIYVKIVVK